ncbi:MAG TPA: ATP-binding protein [Thermoanaerobaculia bacterium]
MIEKLVVDINPLKSVQVPERDGRGKQFLRFAFKRSVEGKEIRRILVRVEDRTREVELAAELEQQERQAAQRVDLAMEMMQIDPDALTDYLTRFLAEIAQVHRLRNKSGNGAGRAAIDEIFRILHSLKGEAGLIGLRSFADKLHRAEDVAQAVRDSSDAQPFGIERLDASVDALLALGGEAKDLIARLSALATRRTNETAEKPAPDLMSTLDHLISDLSVRLGKPIQFVTHWNDADLPKAYAGLVRDVLVQLARNSMVHGVESDPQRRQSGKPVPAVLQVALRRHQAEGQLEIVFQDDGRGLELERIRLRAGEMFDVAILDDEQLAQVIFEPGFSTAVETTSDAGRGVGLDLVRAKIEKAGGMILVHSEPGVFCAFQILLPLQPQGES